MIYCADNQTAEYTVLFGQSPGLTHTLCGWGAHHRIEATDHDTAALQALASAGRPNVEGGHRYIVIGPVRATYNGRFIPHLVQGYEYVAEFVPGVTELPPMVETGETELAWDHETDESYVVPVYEPTDTLAYVRLRRVVGRCGRERSDDAVYVQRERVAS